MAPSISQNPLVSVSLGVTQIVLERHDMATGARGPFVGQ